METRSLVWCPTSCLTPIWGRCIPPPLQGGVAAASIKSREATEEPQTGWSLTRHVSQTHSEASLVSDHPVRAFFRNGSVLLMARPPLLLQGGECTYPKSVSNMKWDTALATTWRYISDESICHEDSSACLRSSRFCARI